MKGHVNELKLEVGELKNLLGKKNKVVVAKKNKTVGGGCNMAAITAVVILIVGVMLGIFASRVANAK